MSRLRTHAALPAVAAWHQSSKTTAKEHSRAQRITRWRSEIGQAIIIKAIIIKDASSRNAQEAAALLGAIEAERGLKPWHQRRH